MKETRKDFSMNFEVFIKEEDDKFTGECKELPGLVVSGKDRAEVIRNIKAAMPLYLRYVPKESFIPVFENSIIPIIHDFEEFNGLLYAATSKDAVVRTSTGDVGAWETINVTNVFSTFYNPPAGSTKSIGNEAMGDYTPQVYCLKAFNDMGTPKLFCGTNASGGIYETLDGNTWALSFNSGEARIHCLEAFKGRLFAGTSTEGKIYSYNGSHWIVALNTPELSISTMSVYRDYLYAGTYPNGVIYRTADGINWQKVFDTNQSFINDFATYKGSLYMSTSKASGGLVFMSEDGINWVENFFSVKDSNFYKFAAFSGSLYLSTGENGKIYKTLDGRKWEPSFQTDEEDVRAMHVFNGYLYFGSSPKGRIFRTITSNTPAPRAMNVAVQDVSSHSAVLTWDTDRESKTIIEYGPTETYGNNIINEAPTAKHKVTLTNLKSLTTYHFRVLTYSDIGSFSGVLDDHVFTTTAAVTPVITSRTHPDQNKWYSRREVEVNWGMHPDVKQYLYMVDAMADTVPEPATCQGTATDGVTLNEVEDGTRYVHLLIEDKAGNVSQTVSHFRVNIDTFAAPPALSSPTHPETEKWYSNNRPVVTWEAPEEFSGVEGYFCLMDEMPNTAPNEKTGAFTADRTVKLPATEDGTKYFHVVTKDGAGNIGTKASHFKINIDTAALPPVISSRTHPDPEMWFNRQSAAVLFAKPHDLSGIQGFFYCVDQSPATVPDESNWVYTTLSEIDVPAKPDGSWHVHARTQDFAGNISTDAAHFRYNIDTIALPPNISSISHPDTTRWYDVKKAQFKLSPPDDLAGIDGYYYSIDNNSRTMPNASSTWTDKDTIFSGDLTDGEWFLHVVSKDRAGNVGAQASHFRMNIDTSAPPPGVFSKTHPDSEKWYNNPVPQLSWDSPNDFSGTECYFYVLDNKPGTVPNKETSERINANQLTLPQLPDGTWYFHIISKDNTGNVGWEAAHFRINIDTKVEAPRIESETHPDQAKWYNIPTAKLSWNVPQDLSKIKGFYWLLAKEKFFKVPVEAAAFTDSCEHEFRVDDEGTYYFHLVCEDNAGNRTEEPSVFQVNIDLKALPPAVVSPTHPNPDSYYAGTTPVFILKAVDDLSGAEGFYYTIDKVRDTMPDTKTAAFSKDATVRITEPLQDGEWYFHAIMRDKAGNTGMRPTTHRFRIETKPPEATLKPLQKFQNSEAFEVKWDGEDRDSGVFCFTLEYKEGEKGKWKVWLNDTKAKSGRFRGIDGITYYFRMKARDNAGNWSAYTGENDVRTTVDAAPPTPVTQINAKPGKGGKILLEWARSVDGVSGVAYYRIYRSAVSGQLGMQINDDFIGFDTKFTDESPDLEDGMIYYYTVRPVDNVANERESGNKQVLVICDRTVMPPVVKSPSHPIQTEWYRNRNIKLSWDTPLDATRIAGYYYIFDQIGSTVPDDRTGTLYTANEIDFKNTSNGTWYFHIAAKDEAGNISENAAHYQVNIDTTAPKPPMASSMTHPDSNQWYNNNSPSFAWTIPSDPSGIDGYYYLLNQIKDARPDIMSASWTKGTMASFVDVPDGVWYFHIVAKDNAGNVSAEVGHFQANIAMTPPPPLVYSSTHPDEGRWYREREVRLQWKPRDYVNEAMGFYYAFDQNEGTMPSPRDTKAMETSASFSELADGIYYFHIVSVDKEGTIGKTKATFRIRIKTKVLLKGTITQSNGIMPRAGASVEVIKNDGTPLGVSVSDKDGNYQIDDLPVGLVRIKVSVKGLPPQTINDVTLDADEQEKAVNISSEIFAMYDPGAQRVLFSYYLPENGLVTINTYNEQGKLVSKIDENKPGRVYNETYWDVLSLPAGEYRYQVISKGSQSGKITRYAIRKIKKT